MTLHRTLVSGIYPVTSVALSRSCPWEDADAVVEGLLRQIEEHPQARLIAVFDLLEHAWESGAAIPHAMRGVKQVIVCLGGTITDAESLALRPHTISVVETTDGFAVNFLETRQQEFDQVMAGWLNVLVGESA